MRFNNNDYLKAFPRGDKPAPAAQPMTTSPQPAGDVFDEDDKPDPEKNDNEDPDIIEKGGEDNGT